MILPIAHLPAKILRQPVEDVTFPLNKTTKRLLKDMLDTVKHAPGVGLAAPQVSKNLNLALIYLEEAGVPPFAIINPVIKQSSQETTVMEEGCLSMPGVFGEVTRPKKITVEFSDVEGKRLTITDETFLARVIQHEVDHLHNTLIIDKLGKISHGEELLDQYQDS